MGGGEIFGGTGSEGSYKTFEEGTYCCRMEYTQRVKGATWDLVLILPKVRKG